MPNLLTIVLKPSIIIDMHNKYFLSAIKLAKYKVLEQLIQQPGYFFNLADPFIIEFMSLHVEALQLAEANKLKNKKGLL